LRTPTRNSETSGFITKEEQKSIGCRKEGERKREREAKISTNHDPPGKRLLATQKVLRSRIRLAVCQMKGRVKENTS
jgi:hypothetical protein